VVTALTAAGASAETPLAAEAQRQYQAIIERHGNQLSEVEKADIRRLLALAVKGIEPLRSFPLENANEPATVFHVWRADRSGR
jgi:hypothetical protein